MSSADKTGVLLFAHGASDPGWSEPFQMIRQEALELLPDTAIVLAYLERMSPDFLEGVALLAQEGCTRVSVLPLFLARGGHLKADLPRLVGEAKTRYPELAFVTHPALGEIPAFTRAVGQLVAAQLGDQSGQSTTKSCKSPVDQ